MGLSFGRGEWARRVRSGPRFRPVSVRIILHDPPPRNLPANRGSSTSEIQGITIIFPRLAAPVSWFIRNFSLIIRIDDGRLHLSTLTAAILTSSARLYAGIHPDR